MHFDPLLEVIHSEACLSFRRTCMELFKYIEIKKQPILFKIRNHLPTVLPNKIFHTTRGMGLKKLPLGEYSTQKQVREHKERKKTILATLPAIIEVSDAEHQY